MKIKGWFPMGGGTPLPITAQEKATVLVKMVTTAARKTLLVSLSLI